MDKYNEYIKEQFNIDDKVLALVDEAEKALAERFAGIDDITAICQMKVLKAFQENHINATHFDWSTGYGRSSTAPMRWRASIWGCCVPETNSLKSLENHMILFRLS